MASYFLFAILLAIFFMSTRAGYTSRSAAYCGPIKANDKDRIRFALNLEFMEAELFCHAALGCGLDELAPYFTLDGPSPIGAQKANLDPLTNRVIEEFCYQEIGHIRAIFDKVGGIPRPLYDLSKENFGNIMNRALGCELDPPFDPYANRVNFLIASYAIPYVGLVGYVGTIPYLVYYETKRLTAGLLGVEAGQDAVFRSMLYEIQNLKVKPYEFTVAEATVAISNLRNELAMCGIKDEGLVVPKWLGAENRTTSNILSADPYSLSYARTPQEVLRTVYGTGNESQPGGFLPHGGNGRVAREFLECYDDSFHD
ncbi:ferritin-like catalase Nec2 [Rutidosis leptorrhynchoides]|uniref:ferritin-like catalase Nec2 n=1 Tax=Rutidosis leptorrhynchoides TaxID=125765 RepID=UPI003A9A3695